MTRIDGQPALLAALRQRIAALGQPLQAGAARKAQPPALASVADLARQRVQQLAADDPQRRPKAVRIYLELVLLGQLGAGLQADPAFATLLDDVQRQVQGDTRLSRAADAVADLLGA